VENKIKIPTALIPVAKQQNNQLLPEQIAQGTATIV